MNALLAMLLVFCAVLTLTLAAPLRAAEEAPKEDAGEESQAEVPKPLSFTMQSLAGEDVDLSKYLGKVVLIVNTASKCGHTPQYKELQALHEKYAERGLAILGFPCNQFGNQDPGTSEEIAEFCRKNYGVTFDMFEKVDVNGEHAAPLFAYLTGDEASIEDRGPVKWNFEKFLLDREGNLIARFRSKVKPESEEVVNAIETALGAVKAEASASAAGAAECCE